MSGVRAQSASMLVHPGAMAGPSVPVDVPAPEWLSEAERAVWLQQAPGAVVARTLTPGTALSFARYCRLVVLEREQAADPDVVGGANHRGILQRLNALELQYGLTPCGRPMDVGQPEKPANPLDRFLNRKREA